MKKTVILLLALMLALTGCFSTESTEGSSEDSDETYYYTYKTAEYTIEAPDSWEKITSFTSEYPDEIRVAFRNNVKDSDFVANLTVIREDNEKSLSNMDYAQKKLNDHAETLIDYTLISQEEITLEIAGGNSKTLLNTFTGKNDTSSQTLNFIQVYLTKGDTAWTATGTYRTGEYAFAIQKLDTMLRSFTLK
jgi:hypothetical protein